jgi:endonuclease/exonuclease/phosphatase family metal-dependent hydrolase
VAGPDDNPLSQEHLHQGLISKNRLKKNSRKRYILTLLSSLGALFYWSGIVAADGLVPPVIPEPRGHVQLRVMTYNVHTGIGMDKKLDLKRIADVINRERPDLVGLQEVDRGVERTGRIDEIQELARLTKMEYAFANNLRYQGGWYGVAILSRFPILATEHKLYRNRREAERRGFIRAEVDFKGERLNFVTTHLDYQFEDGRLFEAEQLTEALDRCAGPLIVVGDLNDEPSGPAYKLLAGRFGDAWVASDTGLTFPSDKPRKRIDYVFLRSGEHIGVRKAAVLETQASDHRPLLVDLAVQK